MCSDCGDYSLAIKNNAYEKFIFWDDVDISHGFEDVKKVMSAYQEIFELMDYPYPDGILIINKITDDSTTYEYGADDENLFGYENRGIKLLDSIPSIRFIPIVRYAPGFTVANQDTINILQKLQFYGVQESGDTIFLKSSKIIDFR